jgi:hypothetical protein
MLWMIYAGLITFALLGLQSIHMTNQARELKIQQERIRRLLLRRRIR